MPRSWSEIYPSNISRPTVTRYKPIGTRRGWLQYSPYETPYTSPSEILDTLRERLEARPAKRAGRLVTKTLPKPELPMEMAGTRFANLFGEGKLASSWVLPKGALDAPTTTQRISPASDYQRQMAYSMGISNVGRRTAMLSPAAHWPSSAFKIPTRTAKGRGGFGMAEPVFGATIDYATGKWHAPPATGGWAPTYGRFDVGKKTTPTMGAFRTPGASARRYARYGLERRKQLRKKEREGKRRKYLYKGGGIYQSAYV